MANTLRSAEATRLAELAQAGASASIIGVSGSGKSNLFNHLMRPATQRELFGKDAANYILLRVNFHYADEHDTTFRSVFSLILDQVELLEENSEANNIGRSVFKRIQKHHRKLIDAKDDPLKVHYHFIRAIRALMGGSRRRLVFLFDQFELVYQDAPSRLFLHLRGLREDYKYRVSYFVFTRSTLVSLADSDLAREEFYELLAPQPAWSQTLIRLKMQPQCSVASHSAISYRLTLETATHCTN